MHPTGQVLPPVLNALPAAVLLAAVVAELVVLPAGAWGSNLIGTNAALCLITIPILSLTPLVAIMLAMRNGAPRYPVSAGASAGRLAAAIGALLYGLHCFDDSPLFVATWYTLATIPVVVMGAMAGRLTLRW